MLHHATNLVQLYLTTPTFSDHFLACPLSKGRIRTPWSSGVGALSKVLFRYQGSFQAWLVSVWHCMESEAILPANLSLVVFLGCFRNQKNKNETNHSQLWRMRHWHSCKYFWPRCSALLSHGASGCASVVGVERAGGVLCRSLGLWLVINPPSSSAAA